MGKLSEVFTKIKDKVKSMSVGQKIALVLIFSIILGFIIFYTSYSKANKYGVLFSNLSSEDGNVIKQALEDKSVEMKIEGNTIYVPKEQVDALRLELAGSLTGGSSGYELMDESSSFGMTDEQFNLQKLRATQGELERTIKSFSQIKNARVHLTAAKDSVFVKEATPAKAAVYVELKPGTKLTDENVKSIIALVSGSVGNLPKENIEVIDEKLNLLSKGLIDDENSSQLIGSLDKQQDTKKAFDKNLEEAAMEMLSLVFGKNNVNVTVNSKLDFDAKEKTVISYDPNKVEVSTQIIRENSSSGGNIPSQSPLDGNMNNTTPDDNGGTTSSSENITNNYKVGETRETIISAPGKVENITAAVIVNGDLDEITKEEVKNLMAGVIGFNEDRGDVINIVSMPFDDTEQQQYAEQLKLMEELEAKANRQKLIERIIIAAIAGIGLVFLIFFIIRSFRKNKADKEPQLDVLIEDPTPEKEPVKFEPLDLEVNNRNYQVEQEIKKYATDKPDQVADIVKSWLAEDER